MRAESPRPRGWATLAVAALLASGCATLPPPLGQGDAHGVRGAPVLREDTAADALPSRASPADSSWRPGGQQRLYRRHGARTPGTDVALVSPEEMVQRMAASAEPSTQGPPTCGGQPVPEGWPDYSSWDDGELLAPFFQCTSPAEFLELQRRVDMPRLLEALEDWNAVRLGALGPMEARAAQVLQRKRFSFLVNATRKYGAYAQVLTLFLFDTAFDDEVRELLQLLAKDKQVEQTLGPMEAVREQLKRRGFWLSDYPDRDEQLRDMVRGLGRAADDAAATIPVMDGLRGGDVLSKQAELPPPYHEAFEETFQALTREHFAPGHVALGTFDSMTFGVPLGFYYLVVGTGHGVYTLAQGRYEQATRELAPAALMVGLYAGGKGVRYLSEARASGAGERGVRLQVPELRLQALKEVVERLRERLGEEGLRQLVRHLQAQREAAVLVADGGEPAAVALYEARGDPTQAQAVLSQAKPEPGRPTRPMPSAGRSPGSAASMVDEPTDPTPKKAGAGGSLGGEATANRRVLRVLEQIRERAVAGTFRRAANYHAHFGEARVLEILRNPDAIYESSGRASKLIYRQGGDMVVVEGPGSGQGQVITGYGSSGIRAESGARALGGAPTDMGTPVTHEMITGGTIPVPPNRPKIPAATQIWPPSDGSP